MESLAETPHFDSTTILVTGAATVIALAAVARARRRQAESNPTGSGKPAPKFTNENITASFVAAIPTITRELNLEVATATQVETFTRSSNKTVLWGLVDLGTNTAQVRVPVTYRFHIRLRDTWKLSVRGGGVVVCAPILQPSLPPAIHTDKMERLSVRGWGRWSPTDLLEELERQITPTLTQQASDPRQLAQVRETCRLSVAEFVRLWLEHEGQWSRNGFTAIQVQFADEAALPTEATLKLLA